MITKKDILTFSDKSRLLTFAEDFIYLLPHPLLQKWISNYTITFPNKSMLSSKYTVLPHGSATLVYLNDGKDLYGDLFGPAVRPCLVGSKALF